MLTPLLLGLTLAPTLAAAAPGELGLMVVPSPLAEEMTPLLLEELGPGALVSQSRLQLEVLETGGELRLILRRSAEVVLDRHFTITSDRLATLRAAVLVIAEAHRLEAQPPSPPPPPIAPPPPLAPPPAPPSPPANVDEGGPDRPKIPLELVEEGPARWWGGANLGLLWAGAAPQLGVELRGTRRLGALHLGVSAGLHGWACCEAEVAVDDGPALQGRFLIFTPRVEAEWLPLRLAALELGLSMGLGVEWIRIDARPALFPGDELRSQTSGWTAVGRAGGSLRGPISPWLGWVVRAGVEVRSGPVGVVLPTGFPIQTEALAAHRLAPYFNLGLEVGWF